jgi:predicted nucleotidyltransferase
MEKEILQRIKKSVEQTAPGSTVIYYGSGARNEATKDSDIDILILVKASKVSYEEEKKIKYPLYDIEFESGKIISPMVLPKEEWEKKHSITPFYANVKKDGILL